MDKEIEIKKKKRKLSIYYGLLVTVICIIGVSFAWFRLYLSQTENNTLASRTCFSTTLTEDTSKISLTDAFPITDEDGLKQTPFTFTIKNNCNSYVKVYITIDSTYRESTDTSYLKDNYMKVNISSKGTTASKSVILGSQTLTDLENDRKGYIIVSTGLKANEEKSYDLRIWMDSAVTTEQGLNKNWSGKIVVVSSASNGPTFAETILANNEVKAPLTTPGKEVSAHTKDDIADTSTESVDTTEQAYYFTYGTGWKANGSKFDLTGAAVTSDTYANSYSSLVGKYLVASYPSGTGSRTAGAMKTTTNLSGVYYVVRATSRSYVYKQITSNKNTTEALLASVEDDYGTSYYFRGAVKNNYVEFANKCWRIVRIVGDGSVKLVLHNDNTAGAANPCSSANNNTNAAFAHFNGTTYLSDFNSNIGDNASIGLMYGTPGSNDYASTHANTNKSTILTNLETWYTNNLVTYTDKLSDTIWCNDKSTETGALGYGLKGTYYSAASRVRAGKPSLKCSNDNNNGKLSKFTVSDTTNGNGNLTYKIGLLTADEIMFAGFKNSVSNSSTYLQENANNEWWTLSPLEFSEVTGTYLCAVQVDMFGGGVSNIAVRPAISLVSSTTISSGTGTSEDPYVVN